MSTVTFELHSDLADWLKTIAAKRTITVSDAVQQLLEEQRMRERGLTSVDVPIGGTPWKATMPFRGLIYDGYETRWERLAPDHLAAKTNR